MPKPYRLSVAQRARCLLPAMLFAGSVMLWVDADGSVWAQATRIPGPEETCADLKKLVDLDRQALTSAKVTQSAAWRDAKAKWSDGGGSAGQSDALMDCACPVVEDRRRRCAPRVSQARLALRRRRGVPQRLRRVRDGCGYRHCLGNRADACRGRTASARGMHRPWGAVRDQGVGLQLSAGTGPQHDAGVARQFLSLPLQQRKSRPRLSRVRPSAGLAPRRERGPVAAVITPSIRSDHASSCSRMDSRSRQDMASTPGSVTSEKVVTLTGTPEAAVP